MTVRFVHAADVHLDSPLCGLDEYPGAPVEKLRRATRDAFENLIDLCLKEKVELLILAGDLYDGDWPDFNTGLYFNQHMVRLREAGIEVSLVRGNHDAASRITRQLRLPENVHVFSERQPETHKLERLGVALHGQSYPNREVTDNLARGYPDPVSGWLNIGVLHTALTGRNGHAPYAPCSESDLRAKGYDYFALGHVHQHEIVSREPHIVFSGCLQGRHVRETGPKGCFLVTAEEGRIADLDFRELDVLRWVRLTIDVKDAASEDDIFAGVQGALAQAKLEADGRYLAARLHLVLPEPLCRHLDRDPERFAQQVRTLGIEAGNDEVWIERITWEAAAASRPVSSQDDGLAELSSVVDELLEDNALLDAIKAELARLFDKLPAEVTHAVELPDLQDRAYVAQLVQRARSLLLGRLSAEEEPP